MNNHMSLKLVGANSSLELNSPITSIYLQEELTGLTTLPGIRETKGMNIGMDGGWTSAQFYEPRLITVKGVIANQDVAVVEQRRKQLIQLLAEKRLALEFQTEAGNHYTMNVVVAGVQMPLSKVLTASYFQINLRADDPLIYDNNALAELEAILRRSSSASSGFTINFPINFQLGTSESRPTIDNFGSSVIYPVITLTGPLTTPEIVNITTNMAFTIDEVLGAGTYTASGIRGAMTQEGSIDAYSGNPIQVTRDAESPISKFSLYGDAEQTTYSGKNLFDYASASDTANTTVSTYRIFEINGLVPSTKYTLSNLKFTSGIAGKHVYLWSTPSYPGDPTSFIEIPGNYRNTLQHNSNSEGKIYLAIYPTDVSTWNELIPFFEEAQLELGSTATAYEPYVGGTASPNPDYPQAVNTVTGEQTVSITGKNLFDNARKTGSTTMGGLSIEVLDYSSIRVNGTVSGTSWCELMMPIYFLKPIGNTTTKLFELDPTKEYTLSAKVVSGTWTPANTGSNLYIQTSANNAQQNTILNGTPSTFTGADGIYRGWMRFLQGDVFNDAVLTFQLEEGNQATEYEAFGSRYTIFLSPDTLDYMIEQGGFTAQGLNTVEPNRIRTKYYIPVEPNTQYTMSVSSWNSSIGSGLPQFSVSYYSTDDYTTPRLSNKDWTAFSTPASFTTPADCHFVRILFNIGGYLPITPADMSGIRIRGDNLSTPIELAKIGDYQDRIYKNDGKWYIEKQVGKVAININGYNSAYTNVDYAIFDKPADALNYGTYSVMPALCESAVSPETTGGYNQTAQIGRLCSQANQTHLWIGVAKGTTQATAKTMLDGKSAYYALATPTTTEITEQALIDQLDAILEAHLYEGINNISNVAISPNLAGDIEIKTGQTLTVINSLSIVGSSGTAEIDLGGAELAMVGSVADELTINGATGAVTKTARIGKIESYAGETITTDYISTSGGLDSDATIYYVLPSSSTSVINTLDSTALAAFNGVVASGGVSAQTNIGSISVDVTTVTAQDVAVVDTKQHTVTINGVGAYSKFSGDWLTLDVGLNELQLITENNTDTGSAVIKYRVGYMGV